MLVEFVKNRIAKINEEACCSNNDLYTLGVNIIKENSDLDTDKLVAWVLGR